MRNFDYMKLAKTKWDMEIVSYIAKIHECKGRQDLFIRQKPVELERLVEIARIQSTESSNKEVIAGCPGAGRSAILAALKRLTQENMIVKLGSGRGTYYVRSDSIE